MPQSAFSLAVEPVLKSGCCRAASVVRRELFAWMVEFVARGHNHDWYPSAQPLKRRGKQLAVQSRSPDAYQVGKAEYVSKERLDESDRFPG